MKCIVTYSSKYGSTEKYAKWIGEALSCEVRDIKSLRPDMLQGYDNLSDEDKLMLDTYGKKIDFSDQRTIKELVDYVMTL